jgi:MSHA biogenesis protein MshI
VFSLFRKKKKKTKALLCLGFFEDGIVTAYTKSPHKKASIEQCTFIKCQPIDRKAELARFVKKNQLKGCNTSLTLNPNEYQILLLDAPNIPEKEYEKAAKWLIKDLISYPVAEIATATFPTFSATQQKKLYVITTKIQTLKDNLSFLYDAELKPVAIDVTEMTLRNVLALYREEDDGYALLYYFEKKLQIMILKEGLIYFIRTILADIDNDSHSQLIDETRRSFEYYQSQLRQSRPGKLLLSPNLTAIPNLQKDLSEQLKMPVETLSLPKKIKVNAEIPEKILNDAMNVIGETQRYRVDNLLASDMEEEEE